MASVPTLLRRRGRRGFRRLVYLSALVGTLILAPNAAADHDQTEPVITNTVFGTLGASGWYTSTVTINWHISDPEGVTGSNCQIAQTLTLDTPGTELVCEATSHGGTTIKRKPLKIDKTPPGVAVVLERGADANGWYNHPLSVAFTGTDATSLISTCTSGMYAGPDNPAALISGSCSDNAGNLTLSSFAFKFDLTPPSLFSVTAKRGNRSAEIAWRKSSDTQVVEVYRAPGQNGQGESVIYRGSASGFRDRRLVVGRKYEYRVIAIDEAANRAERKLEFIATGALLNPAPAERVTRPPMLSWAPTKRASYYNVQLIRNGRRVLSAWPDRPSFRLRRTWLYRGRRYRLRPGVYRWYVWPGFGRISAARYTERPLGSSSFVVTS